MILKKKVTVNCYQRSICVDLNMVDKEQFYVKGDQEGVVKFCIDHVLNMHPKKHKQF